MTALWGAVILLWAGVAVAVAVAVGVSIRVARLDERAHHLAVQFGILQRAHIAALTELRHTGLANTPAVDEYLRAAREALGPDAWREITGEDD